MRLTKNRRSTQGNMDMTPMIDIVFLLLVFFITVTQVTEIEKEEIELPQQAGSEDQKPMELTINVMEDGTYRVSGSEIALPNLISLVGNEINSRGGNPANVKVLIRADQRGQSRGVNEVVAALDRMDIQRVRIAVQTSD